MNHSYFKDNVIRKLAVHQFELSRCDDIYRLSAILTIMSREISNLEIDVNQAIIEMECSDA